MDIFDEHAEISVWLDDEDDHILKKFHCINCGKVVFEYYSSIRLILPGGHETQIPKVIMCHGTDRETGRRCKTKYSIS